MWWREWDSACLSGSDTISVLLLSAAEAAVVQVAAAVAVAAAAVVTAGAAGAAAPHPEAAVAAVVAGHPGAGKLTVNGAQKVCVIYCVKKPCRTDTFHLL